jgi:trypsin
MPYAAYIRTMKKVLFFLLICPYISQAQDKQKIAGGQDAGQYEYLFQAGLAERSGSTRSPEDAFCGGSVISEEYILTAAHCMYDEFGNLITANDLFAFLNTWKLSNPNAGKEYIDVSQIIIHPQYNDNTIENDIALLKLATKTNLTPLKIPQQGDESLLNAGRKCTVIGWGYLDNDNTQLPDILQEVEVEVISNTLCNSSTWYDGEILNGMFCAGYAGGQKDACGGDSGGPLFVMADGDTTQIGVVSWGYGCALAKSPGVYTKISDYSNWITANTGIMAGITSPQVNELYSLSQASDFAQVQNKQNVPITLTIRTITGQELEKFTLNAGESRTLQLPKGAIFVQASQHNTLTTQKHIIW